MSNQLKQLKSMTTVVIDTGDIESIKQYTPVDATTNPSLIMKAAQKAEYKALVEEAVNYSNSHAKGHDEKVELLIDKLFVNFGCEILKVVPGRVSTEVDARLSFDVEGSIKKAHRLISLYEEAGIPRERILIKLASTWEGTVAAKQLEKENIRCNMTLMFNIAQAIASAESKATLISPFVGRIFDWYKKSEGVSEYEPAEDPGVKSVRQIYYYLKKFGFKTEVMGASFRNVDEILELAGCDLLTISPDLLGTLHDSESAVVKKLDADVAKDLNIEKTKMDEKLFRWMMNEDPMATEKLAEGIRNFAKDTIKLENYVLETHDHKLDTSPKS